MLALSRLADAAHGYVGADLYAVCLEGICLSSFPPPFVTVFRLSFSSFCAVLMLVLLLQPSTRP